MNEQLLQELTALRQTLAQISVAGEGNVQHMFAAQQFLRQIIERINKEQPTE